MARLDVLQSFKTILKTEFPRVYIYPEDYAIAPNEPDLPFFSIFEMAGIEIQTVMPASRFFLTTWDLMLYGYVARGVTAPPSTQDVAFKKLAYPAIEKVQAIIQGNQSLGGSVVDMGMGETLYIHSLVSEIPWNINKRGDYVPYDGFVFKITVQSK